MLAIRAVLLRRTHPLSIGHRTLKASKRRTIRRLALSQPPLNPGIRKSMKEAYFPTPEIF
jgi:hypothetical protein